MTKKWWLFVVAGSLIIGIFLFLRFYALTNLPVFADEAIYIRWAQVMRAEPTLRFLPLSDGKQPLYMWMVIPFLKIISDPLVAGRLLSVLSGLGIILGIGVISWYLFRSKKVTLITTLLWALSPYSVFFDKMALVDSLLAFFCIWTFIFAMFTANTLRLDMAMITGFFLGGALLTKSPALFMAVLLPSFFLFTGFKFKKMVKLLGLYLATLAIGYGMYNILRLGPNFNMIASRNYDYVFPFSHLWLNPRDPFIFLVPKFLDWIWKMGPFPIMFLGLLGLTVNFRKYFSKITILLLWFIFPILVQAMFAKVFTARYIYFCMPFLFILAGSVLLVKTKLIRIASILLIVLGIGISLWFDHWLLSDITQANLPRSERSGYLEEWSAGQGIKQVANFIEEQYLANHKTIVVGTEGYFGTLPDGLQAYLNKYSGIIVIGVGLNFDKLPKSLVESNAAGNPTYLVVNSDRFDGNAFKQGLNLLASYPKAIAPDGKQESLLFFKLGRATP